MKVIECIDLTKTYHSHKKVLDHMNLTIEEHTITGIIGRNGEGKTTLLKIIAGFIKETSGEVRVFSERPFNSLLVSNNTVFVDDQMSFPPSLQLQDLIEAGKTFYPNWDHDLAKKLLNYFSFDLMDYHHKLSKGRKSTFNVIVGLAARCPLTIFDEPTNGMDEAVRKDFYRALLKDYLAHPRTILFSSHHLNEIEDLLEDVLIIKNGKSFLHLPISDLKEWAIGLKGPAEKVREWTKDREVVFENVIGENTWYKIVKNDFSEEELEKMRLSGIEVTGVRASDLCVYFTNDTKGGIDDVFN